MSDVFTVMKIRVEVFWVVTLSNDVTAQQCFGESYCLHLHFTLKTNTNVSEDSGTSTLKLHAFLKGNLGQTFYTRGEEEIVFLFRYLVKLTPLYQLHTLHSIE
jgi:hypothetical protein